MCYVTCTYRLLPLGREYQGKVRVTDRRHVRVLGVIGEPGHTPSGHYMLHTTHTCSSMPIQCSDKHATTDGLLTHGLRCQKVQIHGGTHELE